jgi:hypothetical protein
MSQTKEILWPGKSGKEYKYYIYPRGWKFAPGQPGNYIHAKETSPGRWFPVYVGETGDLNERLNNHEKEGCVNKNGATHIHVHVSSADEAVRRVEEKDLILKWQPACNIQHVDQRTSPPATTRQVNPLRQRLQGL